MSNSTNQAFGKTFHPASLTIAAVSKVVFLTLITDPYMVAASSVIALVINGVLRSHSLRHLGFAALTALATGIGLGISHGFFPGPGANPTLAWAYALRPLGMVLWSLVLSSGDRLDWATSLHRFWGLPLSWAQGSIAALRFVPLFKTEGRLVRAWQKQHRPKQKSILTLIVRALRLGAQASLAIQSRTLGRTPSPRTWLRPMPWRGRDTALVALAFISMFALTVAGYMLSGSLRIWDGGF